MKPEGHGAAQLYPDDVQASGTSGVKLVTNKQMRAALERIGFTFRGITKKGVALYHDSGGAVVVEVGKNEEPKAYLARSIVEQCLSAADMSMAPPVLFLALLAEEGASFHKGLPDSVKRVKRFLSERNPDLRTLGARMQLLAGLFPVSAQKVEAEGEPEAVADAPEIVSRETPQKEKEEGVELEQIMAKEAPPEHKHTIREAAELVGYEDGEAQHVSSIMAGQIRGTRLRGIWYLLHKAGHMTVLPRYRNPRYLFSEQGIFEVARYIQRNYQPKESSPHLPPRGLKSAASPRVEKNVKQKPVEPVRPVEPVKPVEPVTVTKHGEAIVATTDAAPPPEPVVSEPKPEPAPQEEPAEPSYTPGAALLILCQHHEVEPAWREHGFSIDEAATLKRVATKIMRAKRK